MNYCFFLLFIGILLQLINANINNNFGHKLRDNFILDPNYINLNHGSYGATPKDVLTEQSSYRTTTEGNPDKFFRYTLFDLIDNARKLLATYINASWKDIVFIQNASEGMNAILRSLITKPDTSIVYLDLEYYMVSQTLTYLKDTIGITLLQVDTDNLFPVVDSEDFNIHLLSLVKEKLINIDSSHKKICTFSHITSMPAIVLPVKSLADLCHSEGATVVVDGAHSLGNIHIDVPSLSADVYVSNGHKWFFTPKGSAFLWVSPSFHSNSNPYKPGQIYPVTISNEGIGESDYATLFSWLGTKDYGSILSFPSAMKFRNIYGDDDIISYNHKLASSGGKLLAKLWNTQLLVPSGKLLCSMVNVELPTSNCMY
jgi:selenocysteine lyase/cysteine desulfurase